MLDRGGAHARARSSRHRRHRGGSGGGHGRVLRSNDDRRCEGACCNGSGPLPEGHELLHCVDHDPLAAGSQLQSRTLEGREVHGTDEAVNLEVGPLRLDQAAKGQPPVVVGGRARLLITHWQASSEVIYKHPLRARGCHRQQLPVEGDRRVSGLHLYPVLVQDAASVELLDHVVTGHACLFVPLEDGPEARPAATMLWQQRGMEVDPVTAHV
mmetsp:Transcript_60458/g.155841  ORF Transcript_60458/g.155841 Transcript_60458/m.155841 type:complete len:212 (-) Transcript_60458:335-970(-)